MMEVPAMNRPWRAISAAALLCSKLHAQTPPAPVAPTPPPPAVAPAAPAPPAATPSAPVPGAASAPAPLDQGPDTLPSLDTPPTTIIVHPKAGTVAVVGNAAPREALPIRAERRLALLGELGWNSLGGFGPSITFHAHPHVSFDLGAGLSLEGWKLGLRSRYNFLLSEVTPFVGVGLLGATGFDAPSQDISTDGDDSDLNIKIRPCGFVQAVAGVDWTSPGGFTMVGAVGYAFLLGGDNVEILTGVPTEEQERGLDALFRSSVVLSLGIGYSFR